MRLRRFTSALVLSLSFAFAAGAQPERRVVAVLPLDVQRAQLAEAERTSLEEAIRTHAGEALTARGLTVLTGETTLEVLRENNVDPAKACEASCALAAAKQIGASYFISGTVLREQEGLVAFVRLYRMPGGEQVSAVQIEGATVRELRRAFEQRAETF